MFRMLVLTVSLWLSAAAQAGVLHPEEVLAGALSIPVFYEREGVYEGTPHLVARADGRAVRVPLVQVLPSGDPSRFLVFLEDPLLLQVPGETILLEIEEADTIVWKGKIPLRTSFQGPDLLSVEEGGEMLLWETDGAGGLILYDTLHTEDFIEEALLLPSHGAGPGAAAVTLEGDLLLWRSGALTKPPARMPLGSRASSAALAGEEDALFGLIDGRILRLRGEAWDLEVVVSTKGIPTSLALGDLNHDGLPDLVATVLEMDRSLLSCWYGAADGSFSRDGARMIPLPGTGREVLVAPITGPAEEDLLLLLHGGSAGLSGVFRWDLSGDDVLDETINQIELPHLAEESVHKMVAGDWDGDGCLDIAVVTGVDRPTVEVYLLGEEGSAGRPACRVPVLGPDVALLPGDFDRNGADDLMVAEGAFRIWLSDGSGRMVALPTSPEGRPARLAFLPD